MKAESLNAYPLATWRESLPLSNYWRDANMLYFFTRTRPTLDNTTPDAPEEKD
ncbi:MAG: hypothetical protein JSR66_03625 [Proteobacteria bacterium]|nr:hypothetical protein [Pseudomonadota bacterium]